ncbi:MAG: dethiobiotin synthase [Hyphomicrobiales bacterium]
MPALFITSTGTEIGKTYVACGLIRHFRRAEQPVDALKPVVSGFDATSVTAVAASDPGVLLTSLGRKPTPDEIDRISPWRFRAPLSPDLAAARENRTIDFDDLVDFSRNAMSVHKGPLIIEGIGGLMVPLDGRRTVLDWMTMLRIPVLLVAGSYLGSISHTLTALHVLAQRRLDIAATVVNETPNSPVTLDETVSIIERFTGDIEVIGIPRLPSGRDHMAFGRIGRLF